MKEVQKESLKMKEMFEMKREQILKHLQKFRKKGLDGRIKLVKVLIDEFDFGIQIGIRTENLKPVEDAGYLKSMLKRGLLELLEDYDKGKTPLIIAASLMAMLIMNIYFETFGERLNLSFLPEIGNIPQSLN